MGDAGLLGFQDHTGHGSFIEVDQKRGALAPGYHIDDLVQEVVRRIAVQPDIRFRFQNGRHFIDDLKEHVGQFVGHVLAIFSHAGKGEKLTKACSDALIPVANHGVVGGIAVEPEAFENFFCKLPIHALTA